MGDDGEFQSFLTLISSSSVQVDLIKLALDKGRKNNGPLKLAIDAESCLDRLYGGYYPDWVCGGQWNKTEAYLTNLSTTLTHSNLDLTFFFNGALEEERLSKEWLIEQEKAHQNIGQVLNHVQTKKKPPPKVWWVAPTYLKSALRIMLRKLGLTVVSTSDDHIKDIAKYIKKNHLHGLLSNDTDFIAFDCIDRIFSSRIKLTYKGSLETTELPIQHVIDELKLDKDGFQVLAALSSTRLEGVIPNQGVANLADQIRSLESLDVSSICGLFGVETRQRIGQVLRYFNNNRRKGKNTVPVPAIPAPSVTSSDVPEPVQQNPEEVKLDQIIQDPIETLTSELSMLTVQNHSAGEASQNGNGPTTTTQVKTTSLTSQKIEHVAQSRTSSGLMSPEILQILKHKHIKLAASLADSSSVSSVSLYRPLRCRIYSILSNLHHLSYLAKQAAGPKPSIYIKESTYEVVSGRVVTEEIKAEELTWPVPTVEKLWLGDGDENKRKRLRAFFTCLHSEKDVLMNSNVVPQHLLVLICVLRYLLQETKLLSKAELEGIILQALINEITPEQVAQDIEVSQLTPRCIQISSLLMTGIEQSLLLNDACGAPIPFLLFNPSRFFNGKVFAYILQEQSVGRNLQEICGYRVELVGRFERLRMAVLDGVRPFHVVSGGSVTARGRGVISAIARPMPMQVGRPGPGFFERGTCQITSQGSYGGLSGLAFTPPYFPDRQRRVQPKGGQLQIAGTVVGSWGDNYGRNDQVRRNPAGTGSKITSLFDQMRVQPKTVPNQTNHKKKWPKKKAAKKPSNANGTDPSSSCAGELKPLTGLLELEPCLELLSLADQPSSDINESLLSNDSVIM